MRLTATKANGERGMALVAVLLFLTMLAGLAAAIARDTRALALGAANVDRGAKARAALTAARTVGVAALKKGDVPKSGRLVWRQGDVDVALVIEAEGGKLDLNVAPIELLDALANAAAPGAPERAAKLAGAIVDWRDPNDLVQLQGAEAPDYRAEHAPYGPANGPFIHTGELRAVLGVDPDLWARLKPAVTVATGREDVDGAAAGPLVERALGGTERSDEKREDDTATDSADPTETDAAEFLLDSSGLYTIDAQVGLKSGFKARERTLVWLDGPNTKKGFEVMQIESGLLPRDPP